MPSIRKEKKIAAARLAQDVREQEKRQIPPRIEMVWAIGEGGPMRTEITASYSHKLNVERFDSRRRYESVDMFNSQKAECRPEEAYDCAQAVYSFCRRNVLAWARAEAEAIVENKHRQEKSGPGGFQE